MDSHEPARQKQYEATIPVSCSLKMLLFSIACPINFYVIYFVVMSSLPTLSLVIFLAHLGFPSLSSDQNICSIALLLELCGFTRINLMLGGLKMTQLLEIVFYHKPYYTSLNYFTALVAKKQKCNTFICAFMNSYFSG